MKKIKILEEKSPGLHQLGLDLALITETQTSGLDMKEACFFLTSELEVGKRGSALGLLETFDSIQRSTLSSLGGKLHPRGAKWCQESRFHIHGWRQGPNRKESVHNRQSFRNCHRKFTSRNVAIYHA